MCRQWIYFLAELMISLVILCWMRLKFNRFTVTGVCGYRYWMTRCSTLYTAISSVCWVQCFDLCLCLCREQSDREQALEDFKTGTLCAYACDYVCAKHVNLCSCACALCVMQCAYVISLISRPLEATSVATRIGAIPLDKKWFKKHSQ